MEMTGEQLIPADRQRVWNALNDPEVLKQSIPGCESLERTGDDGFEATVLAKVGPVKAKFKGAVTLSNINPPTGYTISGEGKGGAAGFAKGSADVRLEDAPGGTLLKYAVSANVGGKLAQIGSRLIDSTAKKMAGDFFQNFSNAIGAGEAPAAAEAAAEAPESKMETRTEPKPVAAKKAEPKPKAPTEAASPFVSLLGLHPFVWTVGLVALVIALIFAFSGGTHQ